MDMDRIQQREIARTRYDDFYKPSWADGKSTKMHWTYLALIFSHSFPPA